MSFPRYPAYKDSGVKWMGEVPEHWEVDRLKYIAKASPSNVDKKSYEGDHAVLLCNYTDVYYNEEIVAGMSFMAATATTDQVEKFTLREGDTIITKDSETADDIAISAYVPQSLPGVVCGYHLSLIRPREGIDGRFIKRLFDSHFARATLGIAANGLTRYGLSQYPLDNFELPLPPAGEQTAIATFLDRETAKIDTLVADYRTLIELLQEKRQAVISHAVTKGLDPTVPLKDSGVEWLGDVPEHWEVGSVRRFSASVETGSTPLTYKPLDEGDGVMDWFTPGDFDGSVVLSRAAKRLSKAALEAREAPVFPANCVLVVSIGATLGKVGYCGVECSANQQINAVIPGYNLSGQFLAYALCSRVDSMRVLSNASTIGIMNQEKTKAVPLVKPPLAEQIGIVRFLDMQSDRVDSLINDAKDAITLLQERRTALISAAVTGKIDVRGLVETEVA